MKPHHFRTRFVERIFLTSIVIVAAFCAVTGLQAADNRTISVVGIGAVPVSPDEAIIPGVISGSAELATDAFKKFQQNQKWAQEAFAKLKIEGLTIQSEEVAVHIPNAAQRMQAIIYGTENPGADTNPVVFYQSFHLKLTGVDKLPAEKLNDLFVKIVDAGKDASVTIGASPDDSVASLAKFQYGKPKEAQQKALELATQNAREQAERLAKLLGVKLGAVVSASELHSEDPSEYAAQLVAYRLAMQGMQASVPSGATRKSIAVSASVKVDFEIAK